MNPFSPRPVAPKTYLFGSFVRQRDPEKQTSSMRVNGRRLAAVCGIILVLAYGLAVAGGYFWLHRVRKVQEIGVADVALFRWKEVRRRIAAQQYAKARQAWAAKDFQMAFVDGYSALRNDPANVEGRLLVADFLQASRSTDMAAKLLEDGLAITPGSRELIQQTFSLLTSTERDRHALVLLHGMLASQFSGPNGTLLRTFEVLATLNADGPAAARKLLDQYPELRKTTSAWLVVARVLWENQEHPAAIAILANYVKAEPDNYAGYAQLADCQAAAGQIADARRTAADACAKFSHDFGPRILQLGVLAPTRAAEVLPWEQAVTRFLVEFGDKPGAILMLGNLAGRKGWVPLARLMYVVSVSRGEDARPLLLYYSDALMAHRRFEEARQVLAELDRQAGNDPSLLPLLWQRQVVVAAALGAHEDARETARRIATQLAGDPEQLQVIRERFARLGIPEAVSELTPRPLISNGVSPKKS